MAMDLTFCFLHYKSRPICEIKCLFRCSTSNSIAHLWPILSQFNYKCNVSQTHLCTMSNKLFWSQQKQGADFWANLSKTDFVLLKLFEVRRDIRVLGPQRLECFDSTAWNWYYSIEKVCCKKSKFQMFLFALTFYIHMLGSQPIRHSLW